MSDSAVHQKVKSLSALLSQHFSKEFTWQKFMCISHNSLSCFNKVQSGICITGNRVVESVNKDFNTASDIRKYSENYTKFWVILFA